MEVRIGQPVDVFRLQVHPLDHVNAALVAPGRAQEAHVDEVADVRVWRTFGHDNESFQQADLFFTRDEITIKSKLLLAELIDFYRVL